jgi:hypothetical protein
MNLYLCVLENTMDNNIHQNQILPIVDSQNQICLFIAPLFILNRRGLRLNKNKFTQPNIYQVRVPFFSYNFLLSPFLFPIFILVCLPVLLYFVIRFRVKVIHSRNHLSAILSVFAKKIFKYLRLISDLRGHYAEEGAIVGRWKFNSFAFKFWKNIEEIICTNSDVVAVISNRMREHFKQKNSQLNVRYIPAIVDTEKFFFDDQIRSEFREGKGITDDEVVYIYIGSIGLWHDLSTFYAMLEADIEARKLSKYKVFILSNLTGDDCRELHKKHSSIITSVHPRDVNKYLCGSDIGVLPGSGKSGDAYNLLYKTMISSKAEEYLCSGLDLLVNERIEEVIELIAGFSNEGCESNRINKSIFYQSQFGSNVVKGTYNKIYENLYD